jgi:hypothetical protein
MLFLSLKQEIRKINIGKLLFVMQSFQMKWKKFVTLLSNFMEVVDLFKDISDGT